jgi:hypothetical protein
MGMNDAAAVPYAKRLVVLGIGRRHPVQSAIFYRVVVMVVVSTVNGTVDDLGSVMVPVLREKPMQAMTE